MAHVPKFGQGKSILSPIELKNLQFLWFFHQTHPYGSIWPAHTVVFRSDAFRQRVQRDFRCATRLEPTSSPKGCDVFGRGNWHPSRGSSRISTRFFATGTSVRSSEYSVCINININININIYIYTYIYIYMQCICILNIMYIYSIPKYREIHTLQWPMKKYPNWRYKVQFSEQSWHCLVLFVKKPLLVVLSWN